MDGEKGGGGWGDYTVTTRMTPALRWAAMRAILIVRDKVTRIVSTDHNF